MWNLTFSELSTLVRPLLSLLLEELLSMKIVLDTQTKSAILLLFLALASSLSFESLDIARIMKQKNSKASNIILVLNV
jgi:hypothetical protein